MRWPFKKTIENNLIRSFETGLRMVQVSLFTRLHRQYSATMPEEAAKVMADLLAVMETHRNRSELRLPDLGSKFRSGPQGQC